MKKKKEGCPNVNKKRIHTFIYAIVNKGSNVNGTR